MSHPLVFNHHSLPFDSVDKIHPAMVGFLKICLGAQRIGFKIILVDESVHQKWFRLELAKGYFWQDWQRQYGDDPQHRETIQAFRSIQTRQPLFSAEDSDKDVELFEVYLSENQENLSALTAAAWNESPLLSFPTRSPWTNSPIAVILEKMSTDGEIINSSSELCNLYSVEQFKKEKPGLQKKVQDRICSGRDLLEQSKKLYPCLCFCGKSQQQLRAWAYPTDFLEQVKEALEVFNTFVEHWREGGIPNYTHETLRQLGLQHKVSGESKTVKRNPKFRQRREFYLPNGKKMLFENHVKFSMGIRMHFLVEPDNQIVFIGYIGEHLPGKFDP